MKKGRFLALVLVCCFAVISGCIKNQPYHTTIDPSLTADIGSYKFTAETVYPATLDSQAHDSITGLLIIAKTSDQTAHNDKIVLYVNKYKNVTGTYSVVRSEAGAYYLHSNVKSVAAAGVVSITHIYSDHLEGYFSFTTTDGIVVKNGAFSVGKP